MGETNFFEAFVFTYASMLLLLYLMLALFSYINTRRYRTYNTRLDDGFLMESPLTPGISVIAPAYNEEKTIIVSTRSLLSLNYPQYEVIIVNDGSTDDSLDLLISEFELEETPFAYVERIKTEPYKRIFKSVNPEYSHLIVVDKENGGNKADASNAGINASQYPYFLCTDSDCIIDKNALLKMIKPVLNSRKRVICVGATLRMSNNCEIENGAIKRVKPPKQWIPRFQELEYLRAYLFGKMGWSLVNCVPNVSGGLGLFDKEIAINSGGYDPASHAEDMDIMIKMSAYMINNKEKYKVEYIPVSACWTEGPPDVTILGRQRTRWARGLAQIFFVHRRILFNPKYKRLGMVIFPIQLLTEFLAPVIEAVGLIYFIYLIVTGQLNWSTVGFIFLYSYSAAIMFGSLVILMDNVIKRHYETTREIFQLWMMAFLEPFIYHPLQIFFYLKGYFKFFTSSDMEWGTMTRQGYQQDTIPDSKAITENNI